MFNLATVRRPRPPNTHIQGILLALFLTLTLVHAASAYVDKSVRWRKSPLRNAQGLALPPAVSYEVWLAPQGITEYLAATVSDTTWTLRATAGVTYYMRVRGVSAAGQKSVFSPYSDGYRSPEATETPPEAQVALGNAYPNPFNARTTLAYQVPEGLAPAATVTLEIYNVRGHRCRTFGLDREPGSHEVLWDGRDDSGAPVPAGMYLARFVCGSFVASTKLTLVP